MKIRIVLQSRSRSNRLPFKSISNIGGYPLVVLCAKRLANTGHDVVVATSNEKEDDRLVKIVSDNKIKCVRGSLNNVYKRFIKSINDLKDHDIIVRATADNAFVDGYFIDEFIRTFKKEKKEYLNFSNKHNMPYGLGVEVMKVGILRKLEKFNLNLKDKEHVTLKLKKIYGEHTPVLIKNFILKRNYNNLRATLDTIDDYIIISNFFKSIKDPIFTKSNILIKKFIKDYYKLKRLLLSKKKEKKIIILGGGQDQLGTIKLANKMGLYTIVFDYDSNAIGKGFADHFVYLSNKEIKSLLFFVKKIKINGVIVQGPDIPFISSRIEKNLNIKNIPLNSALICTDKYKMKYKFKKAGIPVPKFVKYSLNKKKQKINLKYPIVIKPLDRSGSRGVVKCDNYYEFKKYKNITLAETIKKEILIEEFLNGPQISTESLIYKSKIYTSGFVDRNYDMLKKLKPRIIENGANYPSLFRNKFYNKINFLINKIAKELKIKNGIIKGDLVIHNNKPYVIEVALRLSGGDFSETLIPLSTGNNLVENAISVAIKKNIPKNKLNFKFKNTFLSHRYFFPKKGKIINISGLKNLKRYKWLKKLKLFYNVNDKVSEPKDHTNRLGVFVIVGKNKKQVEKRVRLIYSLIRFKIR